MCPCVYVCMRVWVCVCVCTCVCVCASVCVCDSAEFVWHNGTLHMPLSPLMNEGIHIHALQRHTHPSTRGHTQRQFSFLVIPSAPLLRYTQMNRHAHSPTHTHTHTHTETDPCGHTRVRSHTHMVIECDLHASKPIIFHPSRGSLWCRLITTT